MDKGPNRMIPRRLVEAGRNFQQHGQIQGEVDPNQGDK
jgi:hypothetical protein